MPWSRSLPTLAAVSIVALTAPLSAVAREGRLHGVPLHAVAAEGVPVGYAGRDRQTLVGHIVRVGRDLAERRGAKRWHIVSAPRHSKARVHGGGGIAPEFKPDRPGT